MLQAGVRVHTTITISLHCTSNKYRNLHVHSHWNIIRTLNTVIRSYDQKFYTHTTLAPPHTLTTHIPLPTHTPLARRPLTTHIPLPTHTPLARRPLTLFQFRLACPHQTSLWWGFWCGRPPPDKPCPLHLHLHCLPSHCTDALQWPAEGGMSHDGHVRVTWHTGSMLSIYRTLNT